MAIKRDYFVQLQLNICYYCVMIMTAPKLYKLVLDDDNNNNNKHNNKALCTEKEVENKMTFTKKKIGDVVADNMCYFYKTLFLVMTTAK